MEEKNKLQTAVTIVYSVVFFLLIIFAVYMCLEEHSSIYQAREIEKNIILEDYTETTISDSSAPAGIRKEYRFKLHDIGVTNDYLSFYLIHYYAEVKFDGKLVYSLSPDKNNKIGKSPSSNWVFIPLKETDNGKDVLVTLTPAYKSVINWSTEFIIGSRSDIVLNCIKKDAPKILLSVLCIFIGIILIIVQPIIVFSKKSNSWDLFYLGNFFFFIGIWQVTDTQFSPIFFSKNPMALGYISIASLFFLFAPILLFFKGYFEGCKKTAIQISTLAVCVSTMIALFCQVFGIADFRETLILCHVIILICLAVLIVLSFSGSNNHPDGKLFKGIILILSVGVVADLIYYYMKKSSSGVMFTVLALLIYTAILFFSEIFKINKKIDTDDLTGLYNRRKWNVLINNSVPIFEKTGVMILDLNELKDINDRFGHKMGDKALLTFSKLLKKALPNDCMIFRWRGDEFTVLVPNATDEKMEKNISIISEAVQKQNLTGETPEISFAIGYALSVEYPDYSYDDLLKKADKNMYENKREWYKNHE